LPEMRVFGETHHGPTLFPEKMPKVRGDDGQKVKMSLKDRLWDFLIFGVLGFFYKGYEVWRSIIQMIRGRNT